jgi:hypothetical protein
MRLRREWSQNITTHIELKMTNGLLWDRLIHRRRIDIYFLVSRRVGSSTFIINRRTRGAQLCLVFAKIGSKKRPPQLWGGADIRMPPYEQTPEQLRTRILKNRLDDSKNFFW